MKYKLIGFTKDFLLFTRLPLLFGFLQHLLRFITNMMGLSKWIHKHNSGIKFNDFYTPNRKYTNREKLFRHVADTEGLSNVPVDYLEFGVLSGNSFMWWVNQNQHPASTFTGFDTFEGLPEKWLFFKRGDMQSDMPEIDDKRGGFVKGLFQATLISYLQKTYPVPQSGARKVIHMDADLYSSTVFVLTTLAPYLREGDIIMFDEFNVPNHEYAAWELFTSTYYVDYEVLGAVNNYYQVAVKYKGMAKF